MTDSPRADTRESLLRLLARRIRHSPDRLLHSWRNRRARALLRGVRARGVHFVCLGNINRSPYAAAAFRRALERRSAASVQIRSAGLIGPGRMASDLAQREATARGLDLKPHISSLVDPTHIAPEDVVVVMAPSQRRRIRTLAPHVDRIVVLGDLDPAPFSRRVIQDPYGHAASVYTDVFDRIDRCVEVLAEALSSAP